MARKDKSPFAIAEDILAGRREPRADLLIDAIAAVNPTSLNIPARERALRYQVKSALQSLLLRVHGDDLKIVPSDDMGVVSLEHRFLGRTACHALVADLDEDVRSLVQRLLDTEAWLEDASAEKMPFALADRQQLAPSNEVPASPPKEMTVAELLAAAALHIERYEYIEARECSEIALTRSGGGPEAASLLLSLLVDHLALDKDATALADRFSAAAMKTPDVRALLALAAARSRQVNLARFWTAGLKHERFAEIQLQLVDAALETNDLAEADDRLEAAKKAGASPTDLLAREKNIAKKGADARRPLEEEACALLETGEVDAAEERARSVLAKWPESKAARSVLAAIEGRRVADELERLLMAAKKAETSGALARAVELLKSARSLNLESERVVERLARAEFALATSVAEEACGAVLAALRQDNRDVEGLVAYAALGDDLRKRIREAVACPYLAQLEGTGAPRWEEATRRRGVEAVLVLEQAQNAFAVGNLVEAQQILSPYRAIIASLPQARAISTAIALSQKEERIRVARESFVRGKERLAAKDLNGANAEFGRVDASRLREDERSELVACKERLAALQELDAALRRLDSAAETGDILEVRKLDQEVGQQAEALGESFEPRSETLTRETRRAFKVRVFEHGDEGPFLQADPRLFYSDHCQSALLPNGEQLAMVRASSKWLFVSIASVKTSRSVKTAILTLPEPFQDSGTTAVDTNGRLLYADDQGCFIALELPSFDVIALWNSRSSLVREEEVIEQIVLIPDKLLAWMQLRNTKSEQWFDRVVDFCRRKTVREVADCGFLRQVLPGVQTRVFAWENEYGLSIHSDRGALVHRGDLGDAMSLVSGFQHHPCADDEERFVLLGDAGWEEPESYGLALWRWSAREGLGPPAVLEGGDAELICNVGIARELGLVYVAYQPAGTPKRLPPMRLTALRPNGDSFDQLYSVEAAYHARLLSDPASRHCVLVYETASGLRFASLGETPPELTWSSSDKLSMTIPSIENALTTQHWPRGKLGDALSTVWTQYPLCRRDAEAALVSRLGEQFHSTGKTLNERLALVIRLSALSQEAATVLIDEALLESPENSRWLLLLAHCQRAKGAFSEVRRTLESLRPDDLPGEDRAYYWQLRGFASFAIEEYERAREHFTRAIEISDSPLGREQIDQFFELLAPPSEDTGGADGGEGLLARSVIRRAICAADAAIRSGRYVEAIEKLDLPVVWRAGELQSFSRLAEAWLALEVEKGRPLFEKVSALARFIDCVEGADGTTNMALGAGVHTRTATEFETISRQAREFLEGF
ncbi:MAG: hypothetical protein MUC50_15470 [Myxococcota bacterium]|jgi:tetratricopeptide (TPR) repeat protein|nr:hypothetical protein [Myxococcota bacterium]